jgi:outer membrane receptor protein involved in Fe transport
MIMHHLGTKRLRAALRGWSALVAPATGLALMLSAVPTNAQAPAAGAAANDATKETEVQDIVVSASRITAAGFDAPTPTTVFGEEMILKQAQPNIFNVLAQLPALQGNSGTTVNNFNTSTGATGISALNLRGLGTFRTLVLLDGQRVVPSNVTNLVDVSQMPQLLIQRVDVVTGGASASFGSDAVAGVVNFITNKRFEGFKANIQGGITTYGDDPNGTVQAAYGGSAAGGRLHYSVAGEFLYNHGIIPGSGYGGVGINGRPNPFLTSGANRGATGTALGQAQIVRLTDGSQSIIRALNGLITSGPLMGTGFGIGGVPFKFNYGGSGVPNLNGSLTSDGTVNGCIAGTCDTSVRGTARGPESSFSPGEPALDGRVERYVGYGRLSYELSDRLEIFGTVNIAHVRTVTQPVSGTPYTGLRARCDNAFLDPSILQRCNAAGITEFRWATWSANNNHYLDVLNVRKMNRFVIGAEGSFDLFGKEWKFDTYYQRGRTSADVTVRNNILTAAYRQAFDAVRLTPNGPIVCRSEVARNAGCLPFNAFGDVKNSEAAFRWFSPASGSQAKSDQAQDSASVVINGQPFALPAGAVSVAFGAEWRKESYSTVGDPYGAGIQNSPFNAEFPANPVLGVNGANWFAGNFANGSGEYTATDVFFETGIPVFNADTVGKLDLNAGVRATNYSTSGWVATWKIGGTWDTPLDGLRLRAVRSRDIRAPNLSDLFTAPVSLNAGVLDRLNNNLNVQVVERNLGNPQLTPEIGSNLGLGAVYSPAFAPGLRLSFDYFRIELNDAIGNLTNQQIIDTCQIEKNQNFCGLNNFQLAGVTGSNNPPYVNRRPFNVASLTTRGFDIEASYRLDLERIGLPGNLVLRALATHTIDFTINPGVTGVATRQLAGNNNASQPAPNPNGIASWKWFLQQSYEVGKFTFTATERLISSGAIDPDNIVCVEPNCPATTLQNQTTNFNFVPGQTYVDFGAIFRVTDQVSLYGNVDNIFNQLAPPFGSPSIYDTIGRRYRAGARFNF